MKRITVLVLTLVVLLFTVVTDSVAMIGPSSEWEASGFNNGRRIVRDSNGYFHAFYHSQPNVGAPPAGFGCDIWYTYTMVPASEPPSMDQQGVWSNPVNLTSHLRNKDNRYPSVAIETEIFDFHWKGYNTLHVVWQAILPGMNRYETVYANIPVTNPPTPPVPWTSVANLSNTPKTDSLVPAIAINQYDPDANFQHIHVVWQEEDINNGGYLPFPQEDAWFSDIAYVRSTDSGITWMPPAGGWNGYPWDNLTQSPANSQMPSIAASLDWHCGYPHMPGQLEFGYNFPTVHVSYNEDFNGASGQIHVYYLFSPNDGNIWQAPSDISAQTGSDFDAYSNIAVDMFDQAHIVFMRDAMKPREPMRTSAANNYLAGINPISWWAFPGPEIGMYGALPNTVVYVQVDNGGAIIRQNMWGGHDLEFPTVSLDRWQHVNVNWQEFMGDYEIMRDTDLNMNAPVFPPQMPNYQGWMGPVNDSNDPGNDDLFPNLAHKKAAMFMSPNEPGMAGYDEVWTKIPGVGPGAALASPKMVTQDGNMQFAP